MMSPCSLSHDTPFVKLGKWGAKCRNDTF